MKNPPANWMGRDGLIGVQAVFLIGSARSVSDTLTKPETTEIAATGESQTLFPHRDDRQGWYIQNRSDESIWIGLDGEDAEIANADCLEVPARATYEAPVVTEGQISITGKQGQRFHARTW